MTTTPASIALHHVQWALAHIETEKEAVTQRIGTTIDDHPIELTADPVAREIAAATGPDPEHQATVVLEEPGACVHERTWTLLNLLTHAEHLGELDERELT